MREDAHGYFIARRSYSWAAHEDSFATISFGALDVIAYVATDDALVT